MPRIVVLGAGVCGLAASIMLAREGHDVTVLERDPEPAPATPDEAWERWERGGVAQFRLAHFLHSRARQVLDENMPDVRDALLAAGAARVDPTRRPPPLIADAGPRAGDERLTTITGRRPVVEHVFARAADEEARVEVRRGVEVTGLTTSGTHVTGVRLGTGGTHPADLVVDAGGRRSKLPGWLGKGEEHAEDSGFIYYSRFFRPSNGTGMPVPKAPLLSPLGTFSVLTLPGDRDTWSVTVYAAAGDRALKGLHREERFMRLLDACPLHAHWLDGEPLGEIEALGGILDRRRRLATPDGEPVATGVVAVADAWACTNPSLGRGIALGLAHVTCLRDVVREHIDDPGGLARAFDEVTERELTPWYDATVAVDRTRLAEMEALRAGAPPPTPQDMPGRLRAALPVAMGLDADVFRAGLEIMGCLALPREVFGRPGMAEKVLSIAAEHPGAGLPAPTREQVVAIAGGDPVSPGTRTPAA
jgi:2-polyprenyl-6-methoxyphenol hydroxylase-like FAD-dependent oxidoreductase